MKIQFVIGLAFALAAQQLLAADAGEIADETRAEMIESMIGTGAKVLGVLILVVLFAWLRSRFLEQGQRMRGPRVKPWEKRNS